MHELLEVHLGGRCSQEERKLESCVVVVVVDHTSNIQSNYPFQKGSTWAFGASIIPWPWSRLGDGGDIDSYRFTCALSFFFLILWHFDTLALN